MLQESSGTRTCKHDATDWTHGTNIYLLSSFCVMHFYIVKLLIAHYKGSGGILFSKGVAAVMLFTTTSLITDHCFICKVRMSLARITHCILEVFLILPTYNLYKDVTGKPSTRQPRTLNYYNSASTACLFMQAQAKQVHSSFSSEL